MAASVRAELARANISQRQLADHLGKSHTYVQRRASGALSFSADDLIAIAEVLNIPAGRFFDAPAQLHPAPSPSGSAA